LVSDAEISELLAAGCTRAQALEVIGRVAAKTLQSYAEHAGRA
jgi:hypothetical protein